MTPPAKPELDLERLKADCRGFPGRFEFRAEDAYGDDRLVYVGPDFDGAACVEDDDYEDGVFEIGAQLEQHVAEPIARMLNAMPRLIAELTHLRAVGEAAARCVDSSHDVCPGMELVDAIDAARVAGALK